MSVNYKTLITGRGERARFKSHFAGRSEEIRRQSDTPTDAHHYISYSPCRPTYDIPVHIHHLQVYLTPCVANAGHVTRKT